MAVEQSLENLSERGEFVALDLIERGQAFSHQRLEEFPARLMGFFRQAQLVNERIDRPLEITYFPMQKVEKI